MWSCITQFIQMRKSLLVHGAHHTALHMGINKTPEQ